MGRPRTQPKTIGYYRVSSTSQNVDAQREAVKTYCQQHGIKLDDSISVETSSRKSKLARKIDLLLSGIQHGDTILVSELSRLARSISELVRLVDEFKERGVSLISVKENIHLKPEESNIQTKITFYLFTLLAELERDLIRERTLEGLAVARAAGRIGGRRKGQLLPNPLDEKRDEIQKLLSHHVPLKSIGSMLNVSYPQIRHYARTRKLVW